jgi:hypothetical protein
MASGFATEAFGTVTAARAAADDVRGLPATNGFVGTAAALAAAGFDFFGALLPKFGRRTAGPKRLDSRLLMRLLRLVGGPVRRGPAAATCALRG